MLKKGFFAPLYSGAQNDREEKNVIARRNRSNLIFALVEKFLLIFTFTFLLLSFSFAQETYNLDILFKCTAWDSYPDLSDYGISLAGGDVNGDGYSDIAVEALHYIETMETWGIDVYVFFGAPVMDTLYDAVLHCPEHLGHDPSGLWIGDVNGDSIGDIVVGDQGGASGDGEVWIFFGGLPLDTIADLHLVGEPHGRFGCSVAGGDVNGDGCDDVIVGAYAYDGFTLNGRVYVYYGGVLLDTFPDVIISGHNGEAFGKSVGSGGDLNSDGYEDIVVGADENSEAYPGAGKVYVFFGGDPMDTIPDCWLHGEGATHYLGWWGVAASAAENNYDMVITGTRSYPGGFPGYNPGKVYVLYGGSPMDTIVDLWQVGETDSSWLGNWVDGARIDSNTMYGDFLSGAPVEYQFNGRGYLWLGNNSIDSVYDAYLQGNNDYSGIGWKVACAGDVNGDGFDEVMFSNYAGVNPTVWVCRYTGQDIEEARSQSQEARFEVYPNPFSKLINISFGRVHGAKGKGMSLGTMPLALSVRMYDVAGKEVMVYEIKDKAGVKLEIDTRDLPCGVYFVQVETGDGSVIKKVVKIE